MPFGINRATIIFASPAVLPATTILRSGCTNTAFSVTAPGMLTWPPLKSGSSTPVVRRRTTTPPATSELPAIRIRPFACRAIALPNSVPPRSTVAIPPVPNVVSSAPFAFSRAAWMFPPSGPENPPSRSLPLDSTITPVARLTAPQLNSFLPSAENVVSSVPLAFRRVIATCCTCESPTTTILPSGCSAAANDRSSSPPKSILRLPREPNVVSSSPLLRSRATQNTVEAPPLPASEDPPVRLHEHGLDLIGAAEVDRLLPVAGEARIEITRACHDCDGTGNSFRRPTVWPCMSTPMRDLFAEARGRLRHEPIEKRVRARAGGATVLDSTRAVLVWEPRRVVPTYAVPADDIEGELAAAPALQRQRRRRAPPGDPVQRAHGRG